jgi:hypothetical protein
MSEPACRPMVLEDLLRIRFVGDPQLHPDGCRGALVVTTRCVQRGSSSVDVGHASPGSF